MKPFTRITRELPVFRTLREWALAEKLFAIAHYHPRSAFFHYHYTAYQDEALCITSWQCNGLLTLRVGKEKVFDNRTICGPHYIPGEWEDLIEPLYKEAMEARENKKDEVGR